MRSPRPQTQQTPLSLATATLLAALVALPAYFNIQSNTSFEPDKAALVRTLAAVIVLMLGAEAARRWRAGDRPQWRNLDLAWKLLAGFLLLTLLGVLLSADPITSLWGNYERGYGWLALAAGAGMMWAASSAARAGWTWRLLDAALLGATLPLFYGLLQILGYDPVRGNTLSFTLGQRASSSLGNPLFLGDFLLLVLPLSLARLLIGPPLKPSARLGLALYSLLLTLGLLVTSSRSAWFGALAAAVIFLLAWGHQHGRKIIQAGGVATLLAGAALLLVAWAVPKLLPPRLADLFASGGTGGQRLLFWQGVIELLQTHPRLLLTGVGLDTLPLRLAPHIPAQLAHFEPDWAFRIPDRAHTLPLDLLAQTGLLGFLLFTLFWATLIARLLPPPRPGLPRWLPLLLQIAGACLLALIAWLLAGTTAAPLGFAAGLLGGALLSLLIAPPPRPGAPLLPPLAPFLLAALAGRWLLLAFSFPTHAPDLLFWLIAGLTLAIDAPPNAPPPLAPSSDLPFRLAGLAGAAFAFSLSAAFPPALPLWLAGLLLLYLLATLLTPSSLPLSTQLTALLLPTLLLLPALLLNRFSGLPAWLAYSWLLVWLLLQPLLLLSATHRRPALLLVALAAPLLLLLNLPVYGDIAFKTAILHPADAAIRRIALQRAFLLSPYDHNIASGIIPTENQALAPSARLDDPQARLISDLYKRAIRAQPLAPEPIASYGEWLRTRAATDPAAIPLAFTHFQQTLTLSPHDIQTRNRLALLRATTGDRAGALADLQTLLTLDPLYGPTYLNLADLQKQMGDIDAAHATLQQGIHRVPWWDALPRALDALPP